MTEIKDHTYMKINQIYNTYMYGVVDGDRGPEEYHSEQTRMWSCEIGNLSGTWKGPKLYEVYSSLDGWSSMVDSWKVLSAPCPERLVIVIFCVEGLQLIKLPKFAWIMVQHFDGPEGVCTDFEQVVCNIQDE